MKSKDDFSQTLVFFGGVYRSVLDVLNRTFKKMAKELEKEELSLIWLAGNFLALIKKHSHTATNKRILDETASYLLRNEKVNSALVKHAKDDPLFVADVGCCLCWAITQKLREPLKENIDRLRDDCMYQLVVKDKQTDVLCSTLSIVFGYWLDHDFFDNKRFRVAFLRSNVEKIVEERKAFAPVPAPAQVSLLGLRSDSDEIFVPETIVPFLSAEEFAVAEALHYAVADENKEEDATSESGLEGDKPVEDFDPSFLANESDNEDVSDDEEPDTYYEKCAETDNESESGLEGDKPVEDFDPSFLANESDDEEPDTYYEKCAETDNGYEVDEDSQTLVLDGGVYHSVLDVLNKRFKKMAKELEKGYPGLKTMAGDFLALVKKHSDNVTNKKNLDEKASKLLRNENVFNALVKYAKDDPLFVKDVGCCLCWAKNQKWREPKKENIDRLRDDCMFQLVVKEKQTDELCSTLSIVFGYWLDQDLFDNKSFRVAFKLIDVEKIKELERRATEKLVEEIEKYNSEKKALAVAPVPAPAQETTEPFKSGEDFVVAAASHSTVADESKDFERTKKRARLDKFWSPQPILFC